MANAGFIQYTSWLQQNV